MLLFLRSSDTDFSRLYKGLTIQINRYPGSSQGVFAQKDYIYEPDLYLAICFTYSFISERTCSNETWRQSVTV